MSDQLTSYQTSDTEPTRAITIFGAVAAACTALVTFLALVNGVPPVVLAVVGGVGTVSTAVYGYLTKQSVTRQTTPWQDVAAKVTPSGRTISGPADPDRPTGALVALTDPSPASSFQPGTSVYPDAEGDPL